MDRKTYDKLRAAERTLQDLADSPTLTADNRHDLYAALRRVSYVLYPSLVRTED